MKKVKIISFVVVIAIAVSSLSGCSLFKNKDSLSSDVSQSQTEVSSQLVSGKVENEVQSKNPLSSKSEVVANNEPTESQPGQVVVIKTDNEKFDKLFKSNPIDKKYITDSNKAFSNVEMIQISNKYADIWSKEVTSAYNKLVKLAVGSELKKVKAEQTEWVNGKEKALKKINDESQSLGGTMAQVNASGGVMDYYRSRSAQIYREIYTHDKGYAYEYKK